MNFFDTHCHLNFEAFDGKVGEVVDEAKKIGVTKFVIPGTDISTSKKAFAIAAEFEGVYAAVGVHPHHLFEMVEVKTKKLNRKTEKQKGVLEELEGLILDTSNQKPETRHIVAIGEIGLDRYEYKKTKYEAYKIGEEFIELQKELFIAQLQLAVKHSLSVIVHNREAKEDLLSVLTDNWNDFFKGRMVIHCCEPDLEILNFAERHNLFIGVDGDLTYTPTKQEFIKKVPLSVLVLETDSPFLAPRLPSGWSRQATGGQARPPGGWPNTPSNIPLIAQFVADLKGEMLETVARQTTENALKLFNLT